MFKLSEEYTALQVLPSQNITSDTTTLGSAVSVEGYEDDALAIVSFGAIAPNGSSVAVTIQASSTSGGTYAAIGTFTAVAGTDDNKLAAIPVSLAGGNKFIKGQVVTTGSTTGAQVAIVLCARVTVAASGANSATAA